MELSTAAKGQKGGTMPHDVIGTEIKDGDIVSLKAKVSSVSTGETDCNCRFSVIIPEGVNESYAPEFVGNTKLAELIERPNPDQQSYHPSIKEVLKFFSYSHLPPHLRAISKPFKDLADRIAARSSNAETTVALRKLLEAKDAAVRAAL